MGMDRFRRVAQLWNWLPAFRGVAEHEGIHRASAVLATSPSALSRTVKLLEDASGLELFTRRGASLVLTDDGARLLAATRDAMRLVDDALSSAETGHPSTLRARIGVVTLPASTIVPLALAPLVGAKRVRPLVSAMGGDAILDGLLQGDVDLAIGPRAERVNGVIVEQIGALEFGVYGASDHPLASQGAPPPGAGASSAEVFVAHSFVALAGDDGWPVEWSREVAATSASIEGALAFCNGGGLIACLPDLFVRSIPGHRLVRLGAAGPPQPLYAMRREPLPSQDTRVIDEIVSALRAFVGAPV